MLNGEMVKAQGVSGLRGPRQQQMIAPILLIVLGVVGIWWLYIWPQTSLSVHQREAKLKEKLQSIRPPAGIHPGDIQVTRIPEIHFIYALRFDVGGPDCIPGGTHYRKEFANAGFGYNGEEIDSGKNTRTFYFADSDYQARVVCQEMSDVHLCVISIDLQHA